MLWLCYGYAVLMLMCFFCLYSAANLLSPLLSIVFTQHFHFQVFVFCPKKLCLPCPAGKQWRIPGRWCRTAHHTCITLCRSCHPHVLVLVVVVVVVVHLGVIITGPVVYRYSQVEGLTVPAQSGPACCQHHRHSQFSVLSSQFSVLSSQY